mgnify:CR=1 FL=1
MARSIRNMAVIALVLVSTGTASFAQRPQQARYTSPYGPTLPLQLNYFRQDNGVLDPYNAWVNPTNQLQSRLRGIENRQVYDEKATQSAFKQLSTKPSAAKPTGTAGGFMRNMNFFQTRP